MLIAIGIIVSIVVFGTGIGAGRAQEEEETLIKNPPSYDHMFLVSTSATSNTGHNSLALDMDAFTSLLMAKVAKAADNNTNNNSSTGPVLLPATAIGPKIPPK